jgi:hypothetical protein
MIRGLRVGDLYSKMLAELPIEIMRGDTPVQ